MKFFKNKKKVNTDLYLGTGRIIKIYDEYSSVSLPYPEEFGIIRSPLIKDMEFVCLKSYDDIAIFIPQNIFNEVGYSIFGKYTVQDPEDGKWIINISKFIKEYKTYNDTICKSSDTVVPLFIDIYDTYTCNKDNCIICISITEHLDKSDSIYKDLAQMKQIKERLHI